MDPSASDTVGKTCKLRVWQDRTKRDGTRDVVRLDDLSSKKLPDDAEYALVVTYHIDLSNRDASDKTIVRLNSPYLLQAFRDVVVSYPSVPSGFTEPFEMESPFRMLFHFWDQLVAHRESVVDDRLRMHLNLLLDFMNQEMGQERDQYFNMLKKKQITFLKLWTIFPPGEMVYTSVYNQPWLLRIHKTVYEENSSSGKYLEVHSNYTDYDDEGRIGEARHINYIFQKKRFGGENPANITELDIFPAKFVDQESLIHRLGKRGARYLELKERIVMYYDGLAARLKEPPDSYFDFRMGGSAESLGVWLSFTVCAAGYNRPCISQLTKSARKWVVLSSIAKPFMRIFMLSPLPSGLAIQRVRPIIPL